MERDNTSKKNNQEWRWCLVGTIVKTHEYGEEHEIRSGSKHFAAGSKVYLAPMQWGDGYEKTCVIGCPRHRRGYIEVIINSRLIENLRLQAVYKPAVLARKRCSKFVWWSNTDKDRETIIVFLDTLNDYNKVREDSF